MYSKLSLNKVLIPHNSLVFVLFCLCVSCDARVWISPLGYPQYIYHRGKQQLKRFFKKVLLQRRRINSAAGSQKWKTPSSRPSTHLPFFLWFFLGFFFFFLNSSLAAAVRPTFSPGDDEGRTTAMRRRMKSQARGGEKKINRSSQTKGHLLAWNDNLSCWHKGEDRDKSHSFLRRQRQAPDTGDDSSLCASGLQLQGRFSERKEEIWLTPPGFIK